MRIKLYRYRNEQWKERGIGNAKLMRDKAQKRIRFVMRQEKTLKPVGNFFGKSLSVLNQLVNEICNLTAMQGSEKAVCWPCQDFSEEAEGSFEKLAARFNKVE